MATLGSDKVTGVSVVSNPTDAVNLTYVITNKERYQSPLGSDVGKFVQYAGSAYYWNLRTSGFGTVDITAASYGNEYYVIGGSQTLSSSTDAITWSLRTTGTSQTFNQIIYGDEEISGKNIFVAGSDGGEVRSSTDSIGWFLRSSGFGSTAISGATYSTLSGGEFLLGGASTTVTDWWTLRTSGSTTSLVTTVYGDLPVPTYLVKLYNSRSIRGSTDGIIWRARTNGGSGTIIYSVGYGFVGDQQLYISVDSNSQINTSTDSITWTLRTSGQSTTLNFVTVSSGSLGLDKENFVAGGLGPSLRSSTDGIHWVARTSTGFGTTTISASGYGGGLYFIGGVSASSPARAPLNVSTDGIVWSRRTSGTSLNIHGFAYGTNNGVPNYIFYGQSGLLATSTDTNTWIIRTVGSTSSIGLSASASGNGFGTAVTYNNGIYILVNTAGGCRVSTDAITWTLKDFPAEVTDAYSIAYGNNYYFVGANDGVLCVSTQDISTSQPLVSSLGIGALLRASTDSITWTARTTGYGTQSISVLGFGGSYALAYGKNDINIPFLSASTDNITWTFRTSGFGLTTINAFTYGNQIYVAAGNSGLLSTSTDSFTWTIRTSGSIINFQALTYGNNAYISGTSGGGIRFSTDAIIWTLRTSNSSYEINILIYGNNTYLSGETSGALETSITGRVAWQSINLPSSSIEVPTYKGAEEFTIPGAKSFIIPPTASQFYIECIGAGGGGASGRIRGTLGSGGGGGSGAYNSWLIRRSELGSAETITVTPGAGGQGGTNRGLSTSTDGIIWTVSPFNDTGVNETLYVSGYGNGLYVVAGSNASVFVSTDASSWTLRTSGIAGTGSIGNGYGNAFVYGDKYVISAISSGYLSTSTDTITWTPRNIPADNITNIIYENNLYVATNAFNIGNQLCTSVDAITWTLRTVGYTTSSSSYGLAFANNENTENENRYVYAGASGRFATSTNAIQWTFRTSGTTETIYQFINDGTNYYGVGTDGTLMVSTNAIQWSFRTSGFGSTNINSITYNASLTEKYLIGGDAGLTKTSTDGFVWVARSSLFKNQNVNAVSNGNNIYIAAGNPTSTPTAGGDTTVSWTGGLGVSGNATYTLTSDGGGAASDTAFTAGTEGVAAAVTLSPLYSTDGLAGGNGRSVNGEARDSTQVNAFQVTGGGGGAFNTNNGGSSTSYYYGNTYTNGGNTSGSSSADGIPGSYTGNIGGGGGGGGALSSGFNTWIIRTSGFTGNVRNLAYGSSTYFLNNNGLRASTDSINWQLRTVGFGSTSIGSITYSSFNNGEFLAGGRVETQIWTQRTSGFGTTFNTVMYDGTNFFVGGANGFLSASTDGITWILRTSGTALSIGNAAIGGNGLVYASGQTYPYVFCGGSGLLSSSTDSIQWTLRTVAGNVSYLGIAFGTSPTETYVIAGGSGRVNTSTNTINWILRTSGNIANQINSIVYSDSTAQKYIVVRDSGRISSSTNAIQWLQRTSGTATNINQVVYGTVFVAAGDSGLIITSTNAIQWTLRTSGNTSNIYGLAYNNEIYIASGSSGITRSSTNAIVWTLRTSGFGTTTINNSVAGNNIFINVGTETITASTQIALNSYGLGALLQVSTDSITWTARTTSLNTQTITSLGFGGSYVFAHGNNYMNEVGFLNVSTDNIIWVLRTSGFGSTAITAFGYGASSPTAYYVAIGNIQLRASTDTITWEIRTTSFGANIINAFVYGDNYIAAGDSGRISYSTDTIVWTLRTSGFGTTNISSLVYGNSVYVAAGYATLAKSSDGIVWEKQNSGFGTTAINALTYGTSYVAGGDDATITVSDGGTSQSEAGNGGNGTRGGGGGGGAYSVEQGKFGIGGDGGDGYVKITWW